MVRPLCCLFNYSFLWLLILFILSIQFSFYSAKSQQTHLKALCMATSRPYRIIEKIPPPLGDSGEEKSSFTRKLP